MAAALRGRRILSREFMRNIGGLDRMSIFSGLPQTEQVRWKKRHMPIKLDFKTLSKKNFLSEVIATPIDELNFEAEVLANADPVLLMVHAKWCAPSTILEPQLRRSVLAAEHRVRLCKLDLDLNEPLKNRLRITAVPAVLLFYTGSELVRLVGVGSEDSVIRLVRYATRVSSGIMLPRRRQM